VVLQEGLVDVKVAEGDGQNGPQYRRNSPSKMFGKIVDNLDSIVRIGICSLCRNPVFSNEMRCKDKTSYMHTGCYQQYQGAVSAANTRQEMVHTLMSKAGMDNPQDAERFLQQNNWDLELCLQACKISLEANAAKKAAAAAAAAAKAADAAATKVAQERERESARARAAAAAAKKAAADAAAAKAAQERAGVQGLWFFEEHGTWKKFDAVGEQEVELAFQRGLQTVQSTFFNPRLQKQIVYTYDLNSMQQVNASTGFIRRIKREVPQAKDLVAEAPAATSKKKQKIAVGSKVELTSDYAAHSDAGNGPLKPGHKFLRSPLRGVLLCFIRTGADVV
jgi:hypothetical protein